MGRTDLQAEVETARRFVTARERQEQAKRSDRKGRNEAIMLDRRREFLRQSRRVFFESIIEGSDLMPIRYLELGQIAARAVGRIYLPPADGRGSGFATGFLVSPTILLTNHHVLPNRESALAATLTMDADDRLDGLPNTPRIFLLDPDRAYVSDPKLDFAFVGVRPRASDGTPIAEYGHFRLRQETGKVVREEYVSIIQHPNGRQKHIASRNNQVRVYVYDLDLTSDAERDANAFIYYSTDTLKGSSGSPVLSDEWYVVALHRRGVPKTKTVGRTVHILRRNGKFAAEDDPDEVIAYEANEGVRISRVLERLHEMTRKGTAVARRMATHVADSVREAGGVFADGPLARRTQGYRPLQETRRNASVPPAMLLEIARRKLPEFPDDTGYDSSFLPGFTIPLPVPGQALRQELAPRLDSPQEFWLPFKHFSTLMHARRRMPILAAVNIAGGLKPPGGMPRRPGWSYDPRIDEDHQPDDSIFSNLVQRGHLAAREYVYWGHDDDEIQQADLHSFTLTNACPQIDAFNGRNGEWVQLERQVMEGSKVEDLKLVEFMGPIFRVDDPEYDSLRGPNSDAAVGTRIRIPIRFWKLMVWVENSRLKHKAFLLDQRQELDEAGPLEMDLQAPSGVVVSTIEEIATLTDLDFDDLIALLP